MQCKLGDGIQRHFRFFIEVTVMSDCQDEVIWISNTNHICIHAKNTDNYISHKHNAFEKIKLRNMFSPGLSIDSSVH